MKNWIANFTLYLAIVALTVACNSPKPQANVTTPEMEQEFVAEPTPQTRMPSADWGATADVPVDDTYRIGEGDVLSLSVWNMPDLTVPQLLVGPDGVVTLPRAGNVNIAGMTRDEAADAIESELAKYYRDLNITLQINIYRNNKVYVLGRVPRPGVVHLEGRAHLLEALSLAGGVTGMETIAGMEAAIIRGKNQILWVDLEDLLVRGNTTVNTRLQTGDVVYVPPGRQQLVYVMGEVFQPRALPLTPELTLMDALMLAGGPRPGAKLEKAFLLRWKDGKGFVKEINLKSALAAADFSENYVLRDRDVIFLSPNAIAQLNYVLREITPSLRAINLVDDTFRRWDDDRNDLNP